VRTATGADAATLVRFVIPLETSPTRQLDALIAKQRKFAVEMKRLGIRIVHGVLQVFVEFLERTHVRSTEPRSWAC